ncbi:hypothetical protein BH20ACI2_BH20ACI2_26590 [soil metagenome]
MAATEIKTTNISLPAVLVAAWAAVLLIAFFANRGEDVGSLGELVGNLGVGPIFGSGIFDSFIGVLVAALIAASWFGLGSFITSFLKITRADGHSHLLELAINTAVGAAAWSLIWFLLGVSGLYSGIVAAIALMIGFAASLLGLRRVRDAKAESRVPERANGFDRVLLLLIAIPVLLAFIASLAPPTAKDTLLYHFAVPKAFIAQGSNAFIEGNIASYLALGTEMHSVWAMLLGGYVSPRAAEAAAGSSLWAFFPLVLAVVFGWARELDLSRRSSLLAVVMVAAVPTVYHVAASAYIDLALTLFVTLAIYSLTRWWKTLEGGWLVFVAIFLGAALSAKLTTVFVIAAFALMILLRVRKEQETRPDRMGTIAIGGFAALALAGAIASPWYLRTWAETGSPVFPFYMSIWEGKAEGWDVERSNLFQAMNSQYGGVDKNAIDYLASPWNLSVEAQPEKPEFFDGVLGVAFLLGLPLLVLALWQYDIPIDIKIVTGTAAIVFMFWLFSSQQLRYLLPILPVLAIAIVMSAGKVFERAGRARLLARAALGIAAAAGLTVSAAWFLQRAPLRVVLGGESRDEYLTRNLDYYPYYHTLNTDTPPDAKVWLINLRRDTYHIERPVFSDYLFEDWTLRKMVWESRTSQELRGKTAVLGIKYVLARHDFLFDYDRSTLVDDKRPRAENEAKLRIAREFILDPANTIKADSKFSLIKIFSE